MIKDWLAGPLNYKGREFFSLDEVPRAIDRYLSVNTEYNIIREN